MPMSRGRCSPDRTLLYYVLYCPLSRPMAQTSGLQWLAGNSHDLGRPPFPPPPFPPSTPQPRQLQLDCHRRPVIGVFRLVARSCVRGAPNEEQRRHDGSRLALNARSCQAFLHTFASPPERQDLQKIKLHRCTISPLFNGARQPQTATGIPSQSELVLSARWSVPAWKPPPGRAPFERADTARWRFGTWAQGTLHTISASLVLSFPQLPARFIPRAAEQQGSRAAAVEASTPRRLHSILRTSFFPRPSNTSKPPIAPRSSPQCRGEHEISCQEQS